MPASSSGDGQWSAKPSYSSSESSLDHLSFRVLCLPILVTRVYLRGCLSFHLLRRYKHLAQHLFLSSRDCSQNCYHMDSRSCFAGGVRGPRENLLPFRGWDLGMTSWFYEHSSLEKDLWCFQLAKLTAWSFAYSQTCCFLHFLRLLEMSGWD